VHFVVYVKSAELSAGNYGSARMAPFAGSQGVVRDLEGGTAYSFIVIGMRWNWVDYGTVWGSWPAWVSATPVRDGLGKLVRLGVGYAGGQRVGDEYRPCCGTAIGWADYQSNCQR
jgi:hypothetical protein